MSCWAAVEMAPHKWLYEVSIGLSQPSINPDHCRFGQSAADRDCDRATATCFGGPSLDRASIGAEWFFVR